MPFKFNPITGQLDLVNPTGTGDVVGPSSSTDNAVARFDGTTGKLIQDSAVTIDDAGIVYAGTTTDTFSSVYEVKRNNISTGRLDNNGNGMRVQSLTNTLFLRNPSNNGIQITAANNAIFDSGLAAVQINSPTTLTMTASGQALNINHDLTSTSTGTGVLVDVDNAGAGSAVGVDISSVTSAAGALAIGARIAGPSGGTNNYALQLSDTSGNASGGITFGTDTNLYRGASNTLKTDDSLLVSGDVFSGVTSALGAVHIGRNAVTDIIVQSAGTGVRPGISSYHSTGTLTSPGATASSDILLFFGGRGYGATGFAASSTGAVVLRATAGFTDTSMPTAITLETTPTSSVTRVERVRITEAGNVVIGKSADVRGKLHVYDSGTSVAHVIGVQGNNSDTTSTATLAFRTRDVSTDIGSSAEIVTGRDGIYSAAGNRSANLQFWVENADTLTEYARISSAGLLSLKAGAASGLGAKVGGTLNVNTTTVGNVGTGEDDLMSYSMPANTLNTNNETVEFKASGTIANSANAKRIRVKFGSATIFDTGAAGIPVSNSIDWVITGKIIRTGATTQKCMVWMNTNNGTLASYADYSTATETLSGAVTLKLTGEATTDNDIVQEIMTVSWTAAP